MNVTVVGSGNGGLATAFDFALHGHTVRLFDTPPFPDQVAAVTAAGGIHATGEIEGFAEIAYSGHDIESAPPRSRRDQVRRPARDRPMIVSRWRVGRRLGGSRVRSEHPGERTQTPRRD